MINHINYLQSILQYNQSSQWQRKNPSLLIPAAKLGIVDFKVIIWWSKMEHASPLIKAQRLLSQVLPFEQLVLPRRSDLKEAISEETAATWGRNLVDKHWGLDNSSIWGLVTNNEFVKTHYEGKRRENYFR